jgi:two-component system LytT family response regulator
MENKIRCIIIEDEKQTRILLRALLEEYCEDVLVLAEAANVQEGVAAIKEHEPDLVFLDIEMPRESGFSLFKYFDTIDFDVVFTTAYGQYAVKAIKLAALDYLIKPISLEELMETLDRFRQKGKSLKDKNKHYPLLESSLQNKERQKIALPCSDGFVFVEINDIVRCQAEKSYTLIIMKDGSEILPSRNLGEYESILDDYGFIRVHRSHLINKNYIKRFIRGKISTLLMEDGTNIPISNSKKDQLLDFVLGL